MHVGAFLCFVKIINQNLPISEHLLIIQNLFHFSKKNLMFYLFIKNIFNRLSYFL
jgi:hypothetical protein